MSMMVLFLLFTIRNCRLMPSPKGDIKILSLNKILAEGFANRPYNKPVMIAKIIKPVIASSEAIKLRRLPRGAMWP